MRSFAKRTGVYCWFRSRRNPIVFDFTAGKVRSLIPTEGAKWKFKCLVGVAFLPVLTLWKAISTIKNKLRKDIINILALSNR